MNRVVLVTGASRGIGRATAVRFARDGDTVVVNHPGDDAAVAETVAEVQEVGGRAVAVEADVADASEVRAMVERVAAELGRIDVLVTNAGIAPLVGFFDLTEEIWDRTLAVNLKGQFLCCQEIARVMLRQPERGCIVGVSSVSAFIPGEYQVDYCASKAGVMILMRTLAVVLGKEGIRVNSVMPGTIQTGIYEHRLDQATAAAGAARRNPLRRIGRPHEVADAIHWLASEEAAFVNGAELLVDGGQTQLRY